VAGIACLNARDRNLLASGALLTAAAYGVDQFLFVTETGESGGRTGQLTCGRDREASLSGDTAIGSSHRPFRVGVAAGAGPLPT